MLNPPSLPSLRPGTTFIPAQAVMELQERAIAVPVLSVDEIEAAASLGLGQFIDVYA